MSTCNRHASRMRIALPILVSSFVLFGFGGSHVKADTGSFNVPKAVCGPNDHPETGLQGQVPAALRAAGFQGFSCNLELVSQVRGDGANWQSAEFREARLNPANLFEPKTGHICAYHGTSFTTANRTHVGVPVIDVTDAKHPVTTSYLTTTSMLDPWESLKVNQRRELLAADNGHNGGGGPEVDIYDISSDCRYPQFLASVAVGKADGSTGEPAKVVGHEGSWAPDGLTYYGGDIFTAGGQYYAVDTSNPGAPTLITNWHTGIAGVHGLSISDDGYRGYFVSLSGGVGTAKLNDPTALPTNGLLIYDLSEIQDRKPNPQAKLISKVMWKDGSFAQHTIPVTIRGRRYVISVDEGGSAGIFGGLSNLQAACDAGFSPFPMARIVDVDDETNPAVISKLAADPRSGQLHASAARPRRPVDVLVRQPLLQRRQPQERDDARLRLLQLGHSRLRHPQSGASARNRVLQPGGYDDTEPRLESWRELEARRRRLVLCAGASRRRPRHAVDDVSGQRIPDA